MIYTKITTEGTEDHREIGIIANRMTQSNEKKIALFASLHAKIFKILG
jgi:hypothetical protein